MARQAIAAKGSGTTLRVRSGATRIHPVWEQDARAQGFTRIAGVDEAGRGCLFGPVVAAAVILCDPHGLRGVNDSKQLSPEERDSYYQQITERALCWATASVDAAIIDRMNILEASRLAMRLAVQALSEAADYLLIDAIRVQLPLPQQAIVHGDALCRSIAAASILAKVTRDRSMREWERIYPGYGLASNKGYGTAVHLAGLRAQGATPEHRFSYRPVREACAALPSLGWSSLMERQPSGEAQMELFSS
ncbi:MAG: ribonuclease HII [Bryobacterales bacterium]|nr:ribonuclease HII [Bryobacterales bacterium]